MIERLIFIADLMSRSAVSLFVINLLLHGYNLPPRQHFINLINADVTAWKNAAGFHLIAPWGNLLVHDARFRACPMFATSKRTIRLTRQI